MAYEPSIPAPGLDRQGLEAVLEDAATRLLPVLTDGAGAQGLGNAFQEISARTAAGDTDATCDAFNRAAAELSAFAVNSPLHLNPEIGALRLILGITHGWLSGGSS